MQNTSKVNNSKVNITWFVGTSEMLIQRDQRNAPKGFVVIAG